MGYTKQQIKDKVQVKNITRLVSWIGGPDFKAFLESFARLHIAKLLGHSPETPALEATRMRNQIE